MNLELAQKAASDMFKHLELNIPNETPMRFVKMITELTAYHNVSNKEIADTVNKLFDLDSESTSQKMVMLKDIEAFSVCEHHIALMYDMKVSVAYIPNGRIIGLSKIVRLIDMVCKKPQLQEKIAEDIIDIMSIINGTDDIAVHISAKHSCITARGINNPNTSTVTINFKGKFQEENQLQMNFLNQINK